MKAYITRIPRPSLLTLTTLLLLGLPTSTQRHSVRTRVDTPGLMEIKDVGAIYISPATLQSVLEVSLRVDGAESMAGIMDGVTSIHIYTASDHKTMQETRRTFAPIIELRRPDLEQLMYVKSNGGVVNLTGQIQGDNASELYVFIPDDDEYTVISFPGSFSRRQLEETVTQDNRRRGQ